MINNGYIWIYKKGVFLDCNCNPLAETMGDDSKFMFLVSLLDFSLWYSPCLVKVSEVGQTYFLDLLLKIDWSIFCRAVELAKGKWLLTLQKTKDYSFR